MAFDNDDPYQVHAYFLLGLLCSSCGSDLKLDTAAELPSDEWCADVANEARMSGWYVPPASSDGSMDIETCLCPVCATKHGVSTRL
jgi:hypothetical protein